MKQIANAAKGFSLIELTIVLVIVALLTSGLMLGLSAQRENIAGHEAQDQLEAAREALIGFAITNGRLPCPAQPTLPDGAAKAGQEECTIVSGHGVLPWATLGLPETDPWGNRLTYYADSAFTGAVPPGALASFTLDTAGHANILDAATGNTIASELPAVLVSHGAHAAGAYQTGGEQIAGASGDEAENADADLSFVAHTSDGSFDDLVVWVVPTILKSRLVAVGKLP